jgi:hypothetical protein
MLPPFTTSSGDEVLSCEKSGNSGILLFGSATGSATGDSNTGCFFCQVVGKSSVVLLEKELSESIESLGQVDYA